MEYIQKKLINYLFTLEGKTQTKYLPNQPDLVICSLFANFFQQKISSIINVLPNINSTRLNPNLTPIHNYFSCVSLATHAIILYLITYLKTNSPLFQFPIYQFLFHSIYCVHYHNIVFDLSLTSFIDYSDLKKNKSRPI